MKKIRGYKKIKIEMSQSDFFKMVTNEELRAIRFDDERNHLPPEKAVHEFKYDNLDVELRYQDTSMADVKKNALEPWNYETVKMRHDIAEIVVIDRRKQQIIARLEFK